MQQTIAKKILCKTKGDEKRTYRLAKRLLAYTATSYSGNYSVFVFSDSSSLSLMPYLQRRNEDVNNMLDVYEQFFNKGGR